MIPLVVADPYAQLWPALVVSGGQTGADQGGIMAAKESGLETGGWAPHGWRTDEGPAPWLADYGLKAHHSDQYKPRTIANVRMADATLWIGNRYSPGGWLTIETCEDEGKAFLVIPWPAPEWAEHGALQRYAQTLRSWITEKAPWGILNIAGNRERTNPGIREHTRLLLVETWRPDGSRHSPRP